jgi:hypothetical protein
MSLLREIFDESLSHPSDKWESYFDVYERHLSNFRLNGKSIDLVEVGVQKGGSLDMWSTYFPNAKSITGIDVDPECANLKYKNQKISVVIGDQSSAPFWDTFLVNRNIDIFIDDGGHFMDQQILTFEKVFPLMPEGSVYICEDCHTSYMSYNGGGLNKSSTFIEYAKSYVDVLHWNWKEQYTTELERRWKLSKGLSSVHFYDSMVVFEKFGKKDMKRVSPRIVR